MATTKEKLETINSDFNSQYFDTALKKYGRSVSLILPQSYDDSLTFYEAINKLMYTLNGEILRAQSAENTIATDQDSLQATVDAIAHAEIATDLITAIKVTEDAGTYTVSYTTVDGEEHTAGTINIPTVPTAVSEVTMTNENGIYTFTQTKTDGTQSAIGTVEVPQNNPVVEIKDTVVEDSTNGFDFHTFTETTEDGTENSIGHFYLAQNQVTGASVDSTGDLVLATVNQSGVHTSQTLDINTVEDIHDAIAATMLTGNYSLTSYTAQLINKHIVELILHTTITSEITSGISFPFNLSINSAYGKANLAGGHIKYTVLGDNASISFYWTNAEGSQISGISTSSTAISASETDCIYILDWII